MNIEEILDMLDELLDRAWNLPLSGGRCVIDAEKVREMVDDIRLNLPDEIKQAKAIVKDRTEILSSAKSEAEAIVRNGRRACPGDDRPGRSDEAGPGQGY